MIFCLSDCKTQEIETSSTFVSKADAQSCRLSQYMSGVTTAENEMPQRITLRSDGVSGGRENQTATATCYCGAVQLGVVRLENHIANPSMSSSADSR